MLSMFKLRRKLMSLDRFKEKKPLQNKVCIFSIKGYIFSLRPGCLYLLGYTVPE